MGRDEWDQTMKEELGLTKVPGEKLVRKRETRAAAERATRRKARRWTAYKGLDALRRKMDSRLERLECTNAGDALDADQDEEDDDYEDEDGAEQPRGKRQKKKAKGKRAPAAARVRVRPLYDYLLDDRSTRAARGAALPDYAGAATKVPSYPPRSLCVVTGSVAKYKDPASGLRYASAKALARLKDQPPPWVHASGNAPYWEAVRMIKEGDDVAD